MGGGGSQWLAFSSDPRRLCKHHLRAVLHSTSWKAFPRVKTRIEHGAHAKDPVFNPQRADTVGNPRHPRSGFSRHFPAIGQGAERPQVLLEGTGLLDPQCWRHGRGWSVALNRPCSCRVEATAAREKIISVTLDKH